MILDKEIEIFHCYSKDLTLVNDIRKVKLTNEKEEVLATTEEKKATFDLQLDKNFLSQKKLLLNPLLQDKMKFQKKKE